MDGVNFVEEIWRNFKSPVGEPQLRVSKLLHVFGGGRDDNAFRIAASSVEAGSPLHAELPMNKNNILSKKTKVDAALSVIPICVIFWLA